VHESKRSKKLRVVAESLTPGYVQSRSFSPNPAELGLMATTRAHTLCSEGDPSRIQPDARRQLDINKSARHRPGSSTRARAARVSVETSSPHLVMVGSTSFGQPFDRMMVDLSGNLSGPLTPSQTLKKTGSREENRLLATLSCRARAEDSDIAHDMEDAA
jgi:phage FluMu protein gp41